MAYIFPFLKIFGQILLHFFLELNVTLESFAASLIISLNDDFIFFSWMLKDSLLLKSNHFMKLCFSVNCSVSVFLGLWCGFFVYFWEF